MLLDSTPITFYDEDAKELKPKFSLRPRVPDVRRPPSLTLIFPSPTTHSLPPGKLSFDYRFTGDSLASSKLILEVFIDLKYLVSYHYLPSCNEWGIYFSFLNLTLNLTVVVEELRISLFPVTIM